MLLKLRCYISTVCRYGLLRPTARGKDQHHHQLYEHSCKSMGWVSTRSTLPSAVSKPEKGFCLTTNNNWKRAVGSVSSMTYTCRRSRKRKLFRQGQLRTYHRRDRSWRKNGGSARSNAHRWLHTGGQGTRVREQHWARAGEGSSIFSVTFSFFLSFQNALHASHPTIFSFPLTHTLQ